MKREQDHSVIEKEHRWVGGPWQGAREGRRETGSEGGREGRREGGSEEAILSFSPGCEVHAELKEWKRGRELRRGARELGSRDAERARPQGMP